MTLFYSLTFTNGASVCPRTEVYELLYDDNSGAAPHFITFDSNPPTALLVETTNSADVSIYYLVLKHTVIHPSDPLRIIENTDFKILLEVKAAPPTPPVSPTPTPPTPTPPTPAPPTPPTPVPPTSAVVEEVEEAD